MCHVSARNHKQGLETCRAVPPRASMLNSARIVYRKLIRILKALSVVTMCFERGLSFSYTLLLSLACPDRSMHVHFPVISCPIIEVIRSYSRVAYWPISGFSCPRINAIRYLTGFSIREVGKTFNASSTY
jgi:hypothetical protein